MASAAQVIETPQGKMHISAVPKPPSPPGTSEERYFHWMNSAPGVVALPGISYIVLARGPADGKPPNRGDTITVRYTGRLVDETVFNTSADNGKGTTTFELAKLIPGWVAGLRMMRPGDKWQLFIPANLAYGAQGKPEHGVPPNATLIFEVELVAVTPAPPAPLAPPESAK